MEDGYLCESARVGSTLEGVDEAGVSWIGLTAVLGPVFDVVGVYVCVVDDVAGCGVVL